ncbi:hypothetical protein CBR_g4788 [Chara braunii]|uniref:Uncharacterized protein n=1 Tax=Chara braunii TaxID=69332 RepID=A0A388KIT1_CHABU|nr:hypothetical protein CBR_g4788 [Chara braunii]|eukprot:GBG69961.1 hypothetical protein CBR_g4788 [Chara braunii]
MERVCVGGCMQADHSTMLARCSSLACGVGEEAVAGRRASRWEAQAGAAAARGSGTATKRPQMLKCQGEGGGVVVMAAGLGMRGVGGCHHQTKYTMGGCCTPTSPTLGCCALSRKGGKESSHHKAGGINREARKRRERKLSPTRMTSSRKMPRGTLVSNLPRNTLDHCIAIDRPQQCHVSRTTLACCQRSRVMRSLSCSSSSSSSSSLSSTSLTPIPSTSSSYLSSDFALDCSLSREDVVEKGGLSVTERTRIRGGWGNALLPPRSPISMSSGRAMTERYEIAASMGATEGAGIRLSGLPGGSWGGLYGGAEVGISLVAGNGMNALFPPKNGSCTECRCAGVSPAERDSMVMPVEEEEEEEEEEKKEKGETLTAGNANGHRQRESKDYPAEGWNPNHGSDHCPSRQKDNVVPIAKWLSPRDIFSPINGGTTHSRENCPLRILGLRVGKGLMM